MPIDENGKGYSEGTGYKEKIFEEFLVWQFPRLKRVKEQYDYQSHIYLDMTCGSGIVPKSNGKYGSPLIALDCIRRFGMNFNEVRFIDKNPGNIANLTKILGPNKYGICADNNDAIVSILEKYNHNHRLQYLKGIIYFDYNGIPDFDLISEIAELCPTLDILIYLPATAIKRRNGAFPEYEKTLVEYVSKINKENWIVKLNDCPDNMVKKWQWSFLFGSNYQGIKDYKSKGWYLINTEQGKIIIDKLNNKKGSCND